MSEHAAINRIYRLVWSEARGVWIAVAEHAKGRGKRSRARLACALISIFVWIPAHAAPPSAQQLPTGGQVAAGAVQITQGATAGGARMDVTQTSQRGIVDWQRFDVGAQGHVNFNQPSASAVTLNRVQSGQPSQIFGRITANGQVFLANPSGAYFSPSASVDVGGLAVTTHSISDADFMAGKASFTRDGATGSIVNEGSLNAALGGYIALLAPEVRNSGVIVAQAGTVAMASGDMVELQFDSNNTLAGLRTSPSTIASLIDNRLAVQAPGGRIILSAQAANQLQGGVIKNSGSLSASSMVSEGGVIRLVADRVQLDPGSSVSASGTSRGGDIGVNAGRVLQSGSLDASGNAGGTINVTASDQILQTTLSSTRADGSSGDGGHISLQAGHTMYSSGQVSAVGQHGGTVHALGDNVVLAAASLDASGTQGGGTVLVGGDYQGKNPDIANASTVYINAHTTIAADAQSSGDGGKAVVWSDGQTTYYGSISAKGGAQAGNGGLIEVSGKQDLIYGGEGDASAPNGNAGSLLLDPTNLVISSAGSLPTYSFVDPNATTGGQFGVHIVPLSTGNVVVTASQDTVGGVTTAGAVYLFNGHTGALISALTGSTAGDQVGSGGVKAVGSGNYAAVSPNWDNGATADVGAVTWGSGSTGVNGAVAASNSLVGSTASDQVGSGGVTVLTNNHYVVSSTLWDSGATADVGALTWGSGSTGITGTVSAANSLVGSTLSDQIGSGGITALSNGHYVVRSALWDNGATADVGAVTWGNGTTGIAGAASAANSLVGSTASDQVGSVGVTALTNGHYVVSSSLWDNGATANVGAATWGNGTTGISGAVSAINSLVGSTASDQVGLNGVTALTNGNYVVVSSSWNGGFGAATWGDGSAGITGAVSSVNSLVGTKTTDVVGLFGVTALTNGNYVVRSPNWDNGATVNVGAVTWGDGSTGVNGAVSAANSLVGSSATDQVGWSGVFALTNGNYVVASQNWINAGIAEAGAATWGDGSTGITGAVSTANSLVGTTAYDRISSRGVTALTNGNYVVRSNQWTNGSAALAGAATWGNGATGITGAVSAANSLVGSTASDNVSYTGVSALTNGNYVVATASWDNGAFLDAGAATWGNGTTGISGAVSATNSLVGGKSNDSVGQHGATALADGNYVVRSANWDNGATANVGAVTWGDGSTGITGSISAQNSLLGSAANQRVGTYLAEDSVNGTFVLGDNLGTAVKAGFGDPNQITYAIGGSNTFTVAPSVITSSLNNGTAVTLQASNNITISSAITATGSGALTMQAGGSITVGAAISTAGTITLEATGATSDITLNAALTTTAGGNSVVLAAGRNFINNVGASAIDPGAGRFLVYSTSPTANTRGSLAYDFKQYNAAYGDLVLGSGDGFLYTLAPTVTAGLTGSVSKTYDRTTTATLAAGNYSVSGAVDGDTVTLNNPASGSYDTKGVGTGKTVSVSGLSIASAINGTATVYGYQLASTSVSDAVGEVTAKTLTVGATGSNKVYDGTTTASVTLSDDRVGGDTVTLSNTSATFANKNVGAGKSISVSGIAIGGADAGNYTLAGTTASTSADITARTITVGATGNDKVYDGTTTASVTLSDDRVGGDTVTLSTTTATFANKNVGTGKAISVSGIAIGGADAGNYTLAGTTASTSADITARTITVGASGSNKVYDGTTTASVTLSDDRVGGDTVTLSNTTATFANKNVGTGKAISVGGIAIGGADAGNYTLAGTTASTSADITARTITVGASGSNKVYDGTTTASVTLSDDRVGGDTVTLSNTTATFANKNVGTGKAISVGGIAIGGADAGNYTLAGTTASTSADITARTITVGASGSNKVYDGTTTASVTLSDDRVGGDTVTLSNTTATFANKNVGTGKAISVGGIAIGGADAGNYTLAGTTASTSADITARTITVGASGSNKVYDGTTTASVTLSDDRVGGDTVTLSNTTATFANKNVGAGKAISVSGIAIGGADAGNYTLAGTTASTSADITSRTITVGATGSNKVYDGTTTASVTLSDDRVGGDTVTLSNTTATFANKNVGAGKAISVSGIAIGGADAGNYTLAGTTASTSADITSRTITVGATGSNKVYDGTTTASVTLSDDRVGGDTVTLSNTTATFANKNVGTGKTISVGGIAIGGADAGNYTLAGTTASTSADITARTITVGASGSNKVYDGTTTASVTLSDDRVGGDTVTLSNTTATFANKNVGAGKAISVSGIAIGGADAGNYTLAGTTASTSADITARTITVGATGSNKVYDGTTTASVTLSDDRVGGDTVTLSNTTATFANKNVGAGKAISVSGIAIGGADAGNYTLAGTTALTSADITSRTITVGATGSNKVYDGTTTASVTLSDDRVGGDTVTLSNTTATFANKNVGAGKAISVSGIAIGGADAGNYTLAGTTASTSADITARTITVGATGSNKVYDGTTTAGVTLSDDRVGGDTVTLSNTTATFANKNVGAGKAISVSGIAIGGADAGNYTLAGTTASTSADITARTITVGATGSNKVYDGTTTASVTLSDDRVGGDTITFSNTSATFANKNVGAGKSISVSGIAIGGADAGNYTLAGTTASTSADITARTITVGATGNDKVYDGTTTASVTLSDDRVGGDTVTLSNTTATFANKNVGAGKAISVSGIAIGGADAGNYTLGGTTASTAADITAKTLTVGATGINKVYDGTTAATTTLSDDRVAGDTLTLSGTAAFANKNVGTGKTVSVSGISVGGADAGNYSLAATTASTAADITPRTLTLGATGIDKVYDGTTTALVSLSDDRVAGDVLTLSSTAAFADKNVGTTKPISVSAANLSGADAGNYSVSVMPAVAADITPRPLTVTATGVEKVYDGTTVAAVNLADNRLAGDTLTLSGTASFADKNVGIAKPVSVSGISLAGADAANYSVNLTAATNADITPRPLSFSATGIDRPYDGTTAAGVTLSDDRVAGDTLTLASASASFADPEVGTAKPVTIMGVAVSGTDAGNYVLISTTGATTASILALVQLPVPQLHTGPAPSPLVGFVIAPAPAPAPAAPSASVGDGTRSSEAAAVSGTQSGAANDTSAKAGEHSAAADGKAAEPANADAGIPNAAAALAAAARQAAMALAGQRPGGVLPGALHIVQNNLPLWQQAQDAAARLLQSFGAAPGDALPFASSVGGQVISNFAAALAERGATARLEGEVRASLTKMWSELDTLKAKAEHRYVQRERVIVSVAGGVFAVSAGYMLWLLLGGTLASLTFAMTPLWNGFDPLPVLSSKSKTRLRADETLATEDLDAEERVQALLRSTGPGVATTMQR